MHLCLEYSKGKVIMQKQSAIDHDIAVCGTSSIKWSNE